MGKLFGDLGTQPSAHTAQLKHKRFSRFTEAVDGLSAARDADKKFTRFAGQKTCQAAPPPQRESSPALQQPILTADHLNSEAQIPVSILERALPQRFADMHDDRNDGLLA
ncbi:MAG: hypothetical protein ABNH38_16810 [Tateyamaria sp.]|uniref:hypothetical protein n=1 Tax=unclassified Tateyamaria TaxID=2645127 RepID=UPI000D54F278|nr:hypothetical protein [Tateyamaria sp. Alg231-49]